MADAGERRGHLPASRTDERRSTPGATEPVPVSGVPGGRSGRAAVRPGRLCRHTAECHTQL